MSVTLGEAIVTTSLSRADLLAWVDAGILPALEPGRDGTPRWPAEVLELITQIDGLLELDLDIDDVRDLYARRPGATSLP